MVKVAYETIPVISSFVTELVAKHYDSCLVFLDTILEIELTPYTQNFHYLESASSKWLARYKDIRSQPDEKKSPSILTPSVTPPEPVAAKPSQFNFGKSSATFQPPFPSSSSSNAMPQAQAQTPKPFWDNPHASPENSTKSGKINSVLASLAEIGYTGLKEEDLCKLKPPDEYETELEVMAEIRGYFQVSYKV